MQNMRKATFDKREYLMHAAVVAAQELFAFSHDGHIRVGAQNFTALEQLVGAHCNTHRRFVAMFFDVVMRHGPLLPFGYGRRCHASAQIRILPVPTRAKANQKPNSSLILAPSPDLS